MHVKASGGLAGRVAGGWLEVPGMGGGVAGMAPIFSEKTSFFLQNTPFSLEILNV